MTSPRPGPCSCRVRDRSRGGLGERARTARRCLVASQPRRARGRLAFALPLTLHGLWFAMTSGNFDAWSAQRRRRRLRARRVRAAFGCAPRELTRTSRPTMTIGSIFLWSVCASVIPWACCSSRDDADADHGRRDPARAPRVDAVARRERDALRPCQPHGSSDAEEEADRDEERGDAPPATRARARAVPEARRRGDDDARHREGRRPVARCGVLLLPVEGRARVRVLRGQPARHGGRRRARDRHAARAARRDASTASSTAIRASPQDARGDRRSGSSIRAIRCRRSRSRSRDVRERSIAVLERRARAATCRRGRTARGQRAVAARCWR